MEQSIHTLFSSSSKATLSQETLTIQIPKIESIELKLRTYLSMLKAFSPWYIYLYWYTKGVFHHNTIPVSLLFSKYRCTILKKISDVNLIGASVVPY